MIKYWYSLRFRFLISAGVLLVLVLCVALWAYQNIHQLRHTITENLQIHRVLNETTRKIRLNLLDSAIHIEAYLLDPAVKSHRNKTFDSIGEARALSGGMRQEAARILGEEHKKIDSLEEDLDQLTEQARHLFDVRDDANQQFPSLAVGNNVMQPNRDALNNALALAFNEMHEEGRLEDSPMIYRQLVEIRHLWSQLLSNFRLYLANRVGSFNEEALPVQEAAVDTMYAELQQRIIAMEDLAARGRLGFQTSVAVNDMLRSVQNWYQGFEQVKKIHNADGWRVDSKIMRDDIVPLLDAMSSRLMDIETRIGQATAQDVERLAQATQRQASILLWGTAGVLLLMVAIFWSINHLVFRPLAMVVKALRAEASGVGTVLLPAARSQETAALVESFNDMARQVRKRQSDLEHQALHDALTGLPNRTLLQERINHDIQVGRQE
ncbi:MAG: hypothetical protein WD601_13625, partial [Pseudohongiellaceae bacterium]